MNLNLKMLEQAANLAANAKTERNFLLGSIALRQDGTLVYSINSTISVHPVPSAHAEARVLRKSGIGATLWVARVLKDKETWAMAKPCANCQSLITNRRIKKVIYTIGPKEYGIWFP